jgi:hypothetical protein
MKKALILAPIMASILAGCGTFSSKDQIDRRADAIAEQKEAAANRIIKETPDSCTSPKVVNNAVVTCGESEGSTKSNTEHWAQLDAYGKICIAAGGEVDSQSKSFNSENSSGASRSNERAIRAMCRRVDITGAEIRKPKTIYVNGKYYSWVEVALPMGEANVLRTTKINEEMNRTVEQKADKAYSQMDKNNRQ